MIPAGDHSSRSLLHRRVSSWSHVTAPQQPPQGDEQFSLASEEDDFDLSHPLLPELEYEEEVAEETAPPSRKFKWKLWLAFVLLILSGVSHVVLAKLQALPMYNYPTFLNMYANFMYIVISFCYILPASAFGWFHNCIPRAHLTSMLSKKPFMVMGFLDATSAAMQVLASIYLPGTFLVLLPQVAIPLSMLFSRLILRERFTLYQYSGAVVVLIGILVVLFPVLTHHRAPEYSCQAINQQDDCTLCQIEASKEDCLSHVKQQQQLQDVNYPLWSVLLTNSSTADDTNEGVVFFCQWISRDDSLRQDDFLVFVWSLVMVVSCIPMVLSSVYKQVALQVQLDPILVNGWVAVFQFLCGIPLAIPAALASSPRVAPWDILKNWFQGLQCLFRQTNFVEAGCHPDDCFQGALYVHLGLLSSVVYTVSMIMVLKYGSSSSLLYLGLTVMVPLGHLVFSLHSPENIHGSDVSGLCVLVAGLILYRFGHDDDNVDANVDSSDGTGVANPASAEGTEEGNNNNNVVEDKGGFLEFLREPFLLVGDI